MKKILTILASATTLFAFGDLPTGTSFEALAEGSKTVGAIVYTDDTGDQDGTNKYWYSEAPATDELGVITNDVAGSGVSRPDMFAGSENENSKSLQIETTSPLFRTALPNTGFDGENVHPVAIGDGIYLDTLVKFTAADDVFSGDLTDGDKIAIEYVEREAETNVVGDVTNVVDAITAFVIRAGYVRADNSNLGIDQKNYLADVPSGFDKNEWHRLTVRSIANVGGGYVGFVVYLDQVPLEYATSDAAGDATFVGNLAGDIKTNFYNDDIHALYPSVVDPNELTGQTITAVAFSGNGSIDDVVFTATKPNFIANSEAVNVTFSKDLGVTAISVKVGEADPVAVDMTTLTAMLPAGTTAFTVTATIDEANGYTFAKMTVGGVDYTNPASITGYAGDTIAITTTRNNFNVFNGSGDPISGTFQTLGAALAATGVAKIQLAHDYDVVAADIPDGYIDLQQSITLDLNGKILDGGESLYSPLFMVTDGNFVIIDSVGGGKVVYAGPGIVFGATSYIGATNGDLGPTFDGQLFFEGGEGNVVRGKFDETSNTTSSGEPAFLWAAYLGDGDSVESECTGPVSGYWVVAPKGGSTTFALTTTGGAHATVTTSPANVSALTEATQVTITATAEQDYTYDGVDLTGTSWAYNSQTDAISMTTNISENTEIAVPNAVAEQSSDEWPTGQDLDDAAGKAAGDLFPGITNALATADAKAVATWAAENSVAYADKGSILPDAFLLDCANTQQAIDEAAANFKITAITVDGDTVTFTPADGDDYGNGKVVIEGSVTIGTGASWHTKEAGDHFFKATLVVKPVPVATP